MHTQQFHHSSIMQVSCQLTISRIVRGCLFLCRADIYFWQSFQESLTKSKAIAELSLSACCAPTRMAALNLLFYDGGKSGFSLKLIKFSQGCKKRFSSTKVWQTQIKKALRVNLLETK